MTTAPAGSLADLITARFARRRLTAFAVPAVILLYLIHTAFAFDLAGLAQRARMDNATTLRISLQA